MTWKKYYIVEIGGSCTELEAFMTATELLAKDYKDIEVGIASEYYKEVKK